jgi:putative hydrolase
LDYTIRCDTHTHTLFSRHAYSTIEENVRAAKAQGLELLASTDHYSSMLYHDFSDSRNYQYLSTAHEWPREWMGVTLLNGCEADIVDLEGHLFGWNIEVSKTITGDDFKYGPETLLHHVTKKMDYIIASVHGKRFADGADRVQCTKAYLGALDHRKVFILGHIGRSGLDVNVDEILLKAKSMHKLIEINEHTMDTDEEAIRRCRAIAIRCAELDVPISVATDAHISCKIGKFAHLPAFLSEIHFPEELIMSRDKVHFLTALKQSGITDLTALI